MAILGIQPKTLTLTSDRAPASSATKGPSVNVELHDASRIEWKVALPLEACSYEIEFEVQIPTNAFVKHAPWDHFQSFTRLEGGDNARSDALTIDTLRRSALALAQTLKRRSEEFARSCRLAASLFQSQRTAFEAEALTRMIEDAVASVATARARICGNTATDTADLARERLLVDEYASVRLLDCLAGFGRALSAVRASRSPLAEQYGAAIDTLEAHVSEALEGELRRREVQGFVSASSGAVAALERYLERASQLKKHFQEVLFLEAETFQVAERIHHIVAGFVALLASTWAFFWQIALADRAFNSGGKIGSGLLVFAVLAGIVYAAKDRIKEVGRNWISGRVHRHYAQRVAKFRRAGTVIASARESFDQASLKLPDPLNPSSGAKLLATSIVYKQRGTVFPQSALVQDGVSRLKYIFRYDLSPLFSRLDDAVKQVPVLDEATRRVKFVDAPRCYRVPVRVRVRAEGENLGVSDQTMDANLIVHKRGLDRLEFADS
jgi:hypothetical protein